MKTTETIKAITKGLVLAVLTVFALTTTNANEKYDPMSSTSEREFNALQSQLIAQKQMIEQDKHFQDSLKLLIPECKVRLARFKKYKEYADSNPQINQKLNVSIIKDCEERVAKVCGAIMSTQKFENNDTK